MNDTYANPIPGVGHDYIQMLNETVNPANGSVSVRIASPAPKERSLNFPAYVFSYDSNGTFYPLPGFTNNELFGVAWQGNYGFNGPQGSASYQGFSLSASTPNGPATCVYYTDYVFRDPTGGKHSLGLQYIVSSTGYGCPYFRINGSPAGGDTHYNATIASNGKVTVWDTHGNVYGLFANASAEDTNGNLRFTGSQDMAGRTWSLTTFGGQSLATSVPGLASYASTDENVSANFTLNATLEYESTAGCVAPTPFVVTGTSQLVKTLTLPNNQSYQFQYDPVYGLLSKITYPTGATVQYTWGTNAMSEAADWGSTSNLSIPNCVYRYDWPAITKRVVSFDGVTPALEQDFAYQTQWSSTYVWSSKTTTVTTKDLLRTGSPSYQTIYTYLPMSVISTLGDGQPASSGLPAENTITYKDWNGALLKTVTKQWAAGDGSTSDLLAAECETLSNGTSGTFYTYAPNPGPSPFPFIDKVIDKKEYDYELVSSSCTLPTSTPTRETVTTYHSFSNTPLVPSWPSMLDRPSTIIVYDHGTQIAETDYFYDNYGSGSFTSVTATGHDNTNYPASYTNRGNVTTKTVKCLQASCSNPASTYPADSCEVDQGS